MTNPTVPIPVYDTYEVIGCPGGPGHPGAVSAQLAIDTADAIVQAIKAGTFNDEVKPHLLTLCQCNLAELIGRLAGQLADTR